MPAHGSTSPLRSLHARAAAGARWGTPDRDDTARDYAAAKLEDYIRRTVDTAPPLTPEQRDRLALLLRGGAVA